MQKDKTIYSMNKGKIVRLIHKEQITDEGFKHYERLIHKLTDQFSSKTGIEYDSLFSDAQLSYIKAVEKYEPETGFQFSTYLTRAIKNNFGTFLRLQKRHCSLSEKYDIPVEDHTERSAILKNLLSMMSEEAQTVVDIVISCPAEFGDFMLEYMDKPMDMKRRMFAFLRGLSWQDKTIKRVFGEINGALNSL